MRRVYVLNFENYEARARRERRRANHDISNCLPHVKLWYYEKVGAVLQRTDVAEVDCRLWLEEQGIDIAEPFVGNLDQYLEHHRDELREWTNTPERGPRFEIPVRALATDLVFEELEQNGLANEFVTMGRHWLHRMIYRWRDVIRGEIPFIDDEDALPQE